MLAVGPGGAAADDSDGLDWFGWAGLVRMGYFLSEPVQAIRTGRNHPKARSDEFRVGAESIHPSRHVAEEAGMSVQAASHRLEVPGGRLYYEVRGSGPVLMVIGQPMTSPFFAPLADLLPDLLRTGGTRAIRLASTQPRSMFCVVIGLWP